MRLTPSFQGRTEKPPAKTDAITSSCYCCYRALTKIIDDVGPDVPSSHSDGSDVPARPQPRAVQFLIFFLFGEHGQRPELRVPPPLLGESVLVLRAVALLRDVDPVSHQLRAQIGGVGRRQPRQANRGRCHVEVSRPAGLLRDWKIKQ